MPYVTAASLETAIGKLHATAHHLLKIWWTLKQMGMDVGHPVEVDTKSPTPALQRLFAYGDPGGTFFVPFAHTPRFKTMQGDAARSIIQTNIQRWNSSGSVVEVDPTDYLAIRELANGMLQVRPGRNYPQGLGFGPNGFALEEGARVSIPDVAFAVWYYRQVELPPDGGRRAYLRQRLAADLSLTPAEMELILVPDTNWTPTLQDRPLSDRDIYAIVTVSISGVRGAGRVIHQTLDEHSVKVRSMVTMTRGPEWLKADPRRRLKALIDGGTKAILLYGPPRTSKTYAIDRLIPRDDPTRETIQIHDGWGYDELMVGLRPEGDEWAYRKGPLLTAIEDGKSCIVLEEINRTDFSGAIGEVFSLLEEAYRGEEYKIRLRNGDDFYIPVDTLIICTMNTLDRSTEEVDDALFGRMAAIEFPPRVEDLQQMLDARGVPSDVAQKLRELFATIQGAYPLGHGYFAGFRADTDPIDFYMARIRPVLQKHLQNYRDDELNAIDEKVNQLFG